MHATRPDPGTCQVSAPCFYLGGATVDLPNQQKVPTLGNQTFRSLQNHTLLQPVCPSFFGSRIWQVKFVGCCWRLVGLIKGSPPYLVRKVIVEELGKRLEADSILLPISVSLWSSQPSAGNES